MNTTTKLLAGAALLPALAFADNYYWNTDAAQSAAAPLDWHSVSSWKVGGDSQWDPDATAVPVAGTDDVYFRLGRQDFFITAYQDINVVNLFPWVNYGDGHASMTFLLDPAATLNIRNGVELRHSYFVGGDEGVAVANSPKSFSFLSGTLDMSNGEYDPFTLSASSRSTMRFAGADTTVRNATIMANGHDISLAFEDGVTCENVKVSFSPYGGNEQYTNSLVITGPTTDMGDFTLDGNGAFASSVVISNGVHFDSFTFFRQFNGADLSGVPDGFSAETVFTTRDVQIDMGWVQAFAPRGYKFDFGPGSRIGWKGDDMKGMAYSQNEVAFHGSNTVGTNININISGSDSALRVFDGASVESRFVNVGYENPTASNLLASVSGTNSSWLVEPIDSELGAVVIVGKGNGNGSYVRGAKLVVEDGATFCVSTNRNWRNGNISRNTTGIMIGLEHGDDGNSVLVRNGATVTNDLWTGIGGAFLASGGRGGSDNLLRVEDATYIGGFGADSVYSTVLFLSGGNGYSNRLEVVDGAYAKFCGGAMMTWPAATQCGGSSIMVDDSVLEFDGRIDMSGETADYGRSRISVSGKSGRLSAALLSVGSGYSNIDTDKVGFDVALSIAAGRTAADGPVLHLTGAVSDNNQDVLNAIGQENPVDALSVTLDIDRKFATSGHDNVIELIRVDTGNDATRFFSNWAGIQKLCDTLQSTADLKGCTLSCESDWDNRTMVIRLEAGAPSGTVILFK